MKLKLGQATVAIERGDISLIEVDAVVNAANTTLAMGTGVAGALKKRGGVGIEGEAMRLGPGGVGEAGVKTGRNPLAAPGVHPALHGPPPHKDSAIHRKTTPALRP